jgi:hypothetical protein
VPDVERGEALLARTADMARGERTVTLALALCLAVRIEPGLLRLARRRLVPGADAGAESDLWFSPLVQTRNLTGVILDVDALAALRRRLARGAGSESFADDAHALIEEAHADYPEALKLEERLVWQAVAIERDPQHAATFEAELRAALKALATDPDGGRWAATWVAQAWRRLPAPVLQTDAAKLLAIGASLRLGSAMPVTGLDTATLPTGLGWLTPLSATEPVRIGVEVTGSTLRFVESTDDGDVLELPPTTPLVAEISASDGSSTISRLEELFVGCEVDLGPVVGAITVRTLTGRTYTIEPLLAPDGDSAWQRGAAQLARACVAVRDAEGEFATGYFVAPDLVATSSRLDVAEVQLAGRWLRAQLRLRTTAALALVEVSEPPSDAESLDLDTGDAALEDGATWVSRAYPDGAGASREVRGVVRGGRLQLADPFPLPGFAGAPVLVDGRLVGQVRSGPVDGWCDLTPVAEVRHALALARRQTTAHPTVWISALHGVDSEFVEQLREALLERGFETARRDLGVEVGGRWTDELVEPLLTCDAAVVVLSRAALQSAWLGSELALLGLRRSLSSTFRLVPVANDDVTREDVAAFIPDAIADLQLAARGDVSAVVGRLEGLTAGPDRRRLVRLLREVLGEVPERDLVAGAVLLGVDGTDAILPAVCVGLLERAKEATPVVAFATVLRPRLDANAANALSRSLRLLLVNPGAATAMRRSADRGAAVLVAGTSTALAITCAELAWLDDPSPAIAQVVARPEEDPRAVIDDVRAALTSAGRGQRIVVLGSPLPPGPIVAALQAEMSELALILVSDESSPMPALAPAIVEELGVPLGVGSEAETLFAMRALERDAVLPEPQRPRAEAPDAALLARHIPLLRYDSREAFFALSAAAMTDNVSEGGVPNRLVRADGSMIASAAPVGDESLLRLEFLGPSTYANGVQVRSDDHLALAEEALAEASRRLATDPRYADRVYGRAVREDDRVWLQYWLFFYYRDATTLGIGRHEGDWKLVQLELDGTTGAPRAATYDAGQVASAWAWRNLELAEDGDAPVVYVARGSHYLFSEPGTHGTVPMRSRADGKGPEVRPSLVTLSSELAWIGWPGRWGSTPQRAPTDSPSPVGPAFRREWHDPVTFVTRAAKS